MIDAQQMGNPDASYEKPSVKNIIAYSEGGYFGDCDIFSQLLNYSTIADGRDMCATGEEDCSLFVMSRKELDKIRENFMDIYREMQKKAINRFKFHQFLIAVELKQFINRARSDESSDEDDQNDVDSLDDAMSMTSDKLDDKFERCMLGLTDNVMIPGKNYLKQK